jgi:TRAP-type uncharacterized transport system substrate-binding protein
MQSISEKPVAVAILLAVVMSAWPAAGIAQLAEPPRGTLDRANARPAAANPLRERMNAWTVGLAAGLPEGAPLRFATELARALDDADDMRVVPLITRGISDNMKDLLYLRGVDGAIVYGDSLQELSAQPQIQRKVNYIASLFLAELHVFARPEIKSLEDLSGKVVNFNTKGTAAAYTGPIIFDRLQIRSVNKFIPHPSAMAQMAKGDEIAAVVFVSSKPLEAFGGKNWPEGFHFLPVPYNAKLGEYYLPSYLNEGDYPGLIPAGQQVSTIAVPVVLAAFDWQKGSDRYRRMERFVKYFFARLPVLQNQAGYHPKWKDVNLAGKVPGWQRFPPVRAELERVTSPESLKRVREGAAKAVPNNPAEQERFVQEFLKWSNNPAMREQIPK